MEKEDFPMHTVRFGDQTEVEESVHDINNQSEEEEEARSIASSEVSSFVYGQEWENASSFRDMAYQSEEMRHLLKLEKPSDREKIPKPNYSAEHLFPQWIIENHDWKKTQAKNKVNKIADILQTPYAQRNQEQTSTLIHWLMSVWPTAYLMGYKRCGQMFKVFQFLSFNAGEDVIVENERGLTFYIVISGSATVHKDGIGVVGSITKGQSFGELALTEGNDVRSATVRAATKLEVLQLHKGDYDHFVKDIQLAERRENFLVLRDCKIFDNWPRSKIQKMCATCSRKTFKPGDIIFKQGDIPDNIYFVIDGTVRIDKEIMIVIRNRWPTGSSEWDGVAKKRIKMHPVCELGKGSFFGELSIIQNKRRTATAKAVTRSVLLCLDKHEFVHLLRSGRAMETVSKFVSSYKDDRDILNNVAILNGGPSTTAQLNDYVKTVEESSSPNPIVNLMNKSESDLGVRPNTAGKNRVTVLKRVDESEAFFDAENMKYSIPTRQARKAFAATNASPDIPGRSQKPENTKTRNILATPASTEHTVPQVEYEDEEVAKKMKSKNENKAANIISDRIKSKLEPLKQSTQKQIKESQLRLMTHDILAANRKLAYLDELAAVKLNQPAKKEAVSKVEHAAKGKKLGFAAEKRKSIAGQFKFNPAPSTTAFGVGTGSSSVVGMEGAPDDNQHTLKFGALLKSPKSKKKRGSQYHISFAENQVTPFVGTVKSVMLESETGRAVKSNAADDIAKYIDATSSGNTNALPIGKKFTRQNTRDLTGMIAANANTSSNEKDEYNPKIQMMHRQESFARDLEQQQRRASIFKKQGSLKGFVS